MAHERRVRGVDGKLNGIYAKVQERLDVLGLTHNEVAGRIAHNSDGRWVPDRQAVAMIAVGTRTVTDLELMLLAQALECEVVELLG